MSKDEKVQAGRKLMLSVSAPFFLLLHQVYSQTLLGSMIADYYLQSYVNPSTFTFSPNDLSPKGILPRTVVSFDIQLRKFKAAWATICLEFL